jgi:hypothetical protein
MNVIYILVRNVVSQDNDDDFIEINRLDLGFFTDENVIEERCNILNQGFDNTDQFYEKYGVEPYGYLSIKKAS